MKKYLLLYALSLIGLASCTQPHKALPDYFPLAPLADTLCFAVGQAEAYPGRDTLSNAQFYSALPAELWEEMSHIADTTESVCIARAKFRLNERYDALLADIRYAWFEHQSLLIYDKEEKRFTGRLTAAEWYGGDGGQILTGVWLTNLNGEGNPKAFQRQTYHSLRMEEEEVLENFEESVQVWELAAGRFMALPRTEDSTRLIEVLRLPQKW